MSLVSEDILEQLGVVCVSGNDREIKAYCPVHHLVKGRESSGPKWYMNRETGAWLCFSCQQRGSLGMLIDLLGMDEDVLGNLPVEMMKATLARNAEPEDKPVAEAKEPAVYISEYAFNKNPRPHEKIMKVRRVNAEACELHNVRWSRQDSCFLLPVYAFDGTLLGWQEKSKGYFNNVPKGMEKSGALFGYQAVTNRIILMESPLDVVVLTALGIHGGCATFGAFVSEQQLGAVVRAVNDIVLAFDQDEAGDAATEFVGNKLRNMGARVKYFRYPAKAYRAGKDIGDLVKNGYADIVRTSIESATSFR